MTDQEIRQMIENGIDRGVIEYVMSLEEVGQDFQDQLLSVLATNGYDAFEGALFQLYDWGVLNEDPFDGEVELYPEDEAKLNEAIDYVMSLEAPPKEVPIQMQYLNNTLIMRKLFYYRGDILEDVAPNVHALAEINTNKGQNWNIEFWSVSNLTIDKSLDPFDFAVLDVIYTLHCNGIKMFSTKWIDMLLSGSNSKAPTPNSIARIDRTIDKLSYIHVKYEIDDKKADETPLIDVMRMGNNLGYYYYLNGINNLYEYAHDVHQFTNIPSSYLDTSKLPKDFAFANTETAMIIKRRVIQRVMRILYQNSKKSKIKNWNRLSLIQKKNKENGLFPELGLMPDIEGLDDTEAQKKLKQWRTKQKPAYIKVVRGTLENLKRQYVILDYEEHKDNDSKSLRDPVTGFDIICFTKTEEQALKGMRDELKAEYVSNLLKKHHESK